VLQLAHATLAGFVVDLQALDHAAQLGRTPPQHA
jgi:hypothetical protein